jgi:manganese/zinc/iron transport system permease protein
VITAASSDPAWTADLWRLLTFADAPTRTVLVGTALLGVAAATVGSFAMLRRRSLVGDAVAHSALPGICLAYLVVGDRGLVALLVGALIAGLCGVACIVAVRSWTRIKEDAATGIVLASFFGLGIVLSRLIQNMPGGNRAGLDGFLFGKAASMVRSDALLIGGVAVATVGTVAVLFKEWTLVAFDRDFAAAQGWPVLRLDLLLMALVCVVTVTGLPAVGVVLMVALLVAPPAAARFWTDRLSTMVWIAAAIGALSGLVGTALSATLPPPPGALSRGWPTGPLIALVAGAAFVVSLLAAPRRGLLAAAWRRRAVGRRIRRQNALRAAFEAAELAGGPQASWRPAERGGISADQLAGLLRDRLVRRVGSDGRLVLTDAGVGEATRIVRAHRLWELYLIRHQSVAPDHVDRDADEIEHLLPPELLRDLERQLAAGERLPASPHPLAGEGRG